MLLEICMQHHSVVFALSRQVNKQKVCENNSYPLRRLLSIGKISSSKGVLTVRPWMVLYPHSECCDLQAAAQRSQRKMTIRCVRK